jgi:hypothetical protein
VLGAPRRPVRKPPQLRLTYSGSVPLIRSVAEIASIIRARCVGVLSEDELALVLPLVLPTPRQPRTEAVRAPRTPDVASPPKKGPAKRKRR